MFDIPNFIDKISHRLAHDLPPQFKEMPSELEKSFRVILQDIFSRLDLVTREEFDIQSKVLEQTRAKADALEKQLTEIEQKLKAIP